MRDADQRLLDAHERMLAEAVAFLDAAKPSFSTPTEAVILALAHRVIQLGHALHNFCEAGFAGEAGPVSRAMLSGLGVLVAIVDSERDGRALAFIDFSLRERDRRSPIYTELGFFTPDEASEHLARFHEFEERQLKWYREQNVTPARLGDNPRTWHGLPNERALFEKMGMVHLYDLDYRWHSDETHISFGALDGDVLSGDVMFGPKFESPYEVILTSMQVIPETIAQINIAFDLGRRDDALEIKMRMQEAFARYTRPS